MSHLAYPQEYKTQSVTGILNVLEVIEIKEAKVLTIYRLLLQYKQIMVSIWVYASLDKNLNFLQHVGNLQDRQDILLCIPCSIALEAIQPGSQINLILLWDTDQILSEHIDLYQLTAGHQNRDETHSIGSCFLSLHADEFSLSVANRATPTSGCL